MSRQHSAHHDTVGRTAMADPFVRRVVRTIEHHDMLQPGDKVLVGVSSGPDSVVLLHVLHTLAERFGIRLATAHLDHGLRPEAAQTEADLVRRLTRRFGLAGHTGKLEKIPDRGSMEEQLRNLRYAFFERTAAQHDYTKIALGHHADDNAEAVLMHMLRGSGLRGLAGIPPVRGNRIIRPLIAVRRCEILAYAERKGLAYMQDASNLDPRFERNRIRHELIPLLERQYNPNLVRTLNRTAALCREEESWLASFLAPRVLQATAQSSADVLELRRTSLDPMPRPLQRQMIRAALRNWQGHLRRIGSNHIEALAALLEPGRGGRRLNLPYDMTAETTETILRFRRTAAGCSRGEFHRPYRYSLPAVGPDSVELRIPEANALLRFCPIDIARVGSLQVAERHMILLDMNRLNFPLTVRNFRAGDHFRPFGLQGRQKLKKLFIDRKIPRSDRHRIPLLISDNHILWVVGVRRGSLAAVSPGTIQVLRVQAEAL